MGSLITDMIIRIDLTVPEIEAIAPDERSNFFSEVIRCSRLGYHRIVFPRPVAAWVGENTDLSMIDKAHLKRLRSEYTQLAGQAEDSPLIVRVVRNGGIERSNDGRIVSIGYEELIEGGFLLKSILLLENGVNDGRIIALVLRHEAKRIAFGELAYEVANGGGSTTAGELERLVDLGRVVACVCDTDIKVPGGARSPTFNTVMARSASIPLVGMAVGTPGSEAENFIPLNIIDQMFAATHPDACRSLHQVMEAQGDCETDDCFWLYFDIKRGISEMMSHLNTEVKIDWACRKLGVDRNGLAWHEISGFGDGVIASFFNDNKAQAEFFQFSRRQYWASHFSDWIRKILWIVCGRVALRTG
jgi:hypothetical protein